MNSAEKWAEIAPALKTHDTMTPQLVLPEEQQEEVMQFVLLGCSSNEEAESSSYAKLESDS